MATSSLANHHAPVCSALVSGSSVLPARLAVSMERADGTAPGRVGLTQRHNYNPTDLLTCKLAPHRLLLPPACATTGAPPPTSSARRLSSSKRLQQLVQLDLEDGWGVQPVQPAPQQPAPRAATGTTTPAALPQPRRQGPRQPPAPPAAPVVGDQGQGMATTRRLGRKAVLGGEGAARAAPAGAGPKLAPPAGPSVAPSGKAAKPRAPYVNLQSEPGMMGMALLHTRLQRGESGVLSPDEVRELKDKISQTKGTRAASTPGGRGGSKLPAGGPLATAAAAAGLDPTTAAASPSAATAAIKAAQAVSKARRQQRRQVYKDEDGNVIGVEEVDEDVTKAPVFSLTIGEADTEYAEYDRQGNVVRRASAALDGPPSAGGDGAELEEGEEEEEEEEEEEDEFDFGGAGGVSGWGALARVEGGTAGRGLELVEEGEEGEEGQAKGSTPLSAREVEVLLGTQGAEGVAALHGGQDDEEQEWGLEELGGKQRGQRTLMEELGVLRRRGAQRQPATREEAEEARQLAGTLAGEGAAVQWGGSGLNMPAGADLEAQERLLTRMFKPHKVKELLAHQRAAYEASFELKKGGSTRGKFGDEARLHRQLRVVAGSAANKRLISSQGAQTRPMMEKVRAAIFNMILSQAGSTSELSPSSRWLDLFAGTGSVGIEALSRGAGIAHFVEFDPWVCRNILGANITACGFNKRAVVHTSKAEDFLRRARELPRYAGGAFDFISMCPPYLLVSYPDLFSLLEGSPLLHERTILFVEYPKQLSIQVPDKLGQHLVKVRDRKYGRTWVAVYAPLGTGQLSLAREEDWGDELY